LSILIQDKSVLLKGKRNFALQAGAAGKKSEDQPDRIFERFYLINRKQSRAVLIKNYSSRSITFALSQ